MVGMLNFRADSTPYLCLSIDKYFIFFRNDTLCLHAGYIAS